MILTKKKALAITIELWEWLAETGKGKGSWSGWDKYGRMGAYCPVCEYAARHDRRFGCEGCPIKDKFGSCYSTYYRYWEDADTTDDSEYSDNRKKYATLFLEQLRQL